MGTQLGANSSAKYPSASVGFWRILSENLLWWLGFWKRKMKFGEMEAMNKTHGQWPIGHAVYKSRYIYFPIN